MNRETAIEVKKAISKQLLTLPRAIKTAAERREFFECFGFPMSVNGVALTKKGRRYVIKILLESEGTVRIGALSSAFSIYPGEIVVEVIGRIKFFRINTTQRIRPATPGTSIGHYQGGTGTFGCLVQDLEGVYILSNNHVLANWDNASLGDEILQPGPADSGVVHRDEIASLKDYVPVGPTLSNEVDAAIAEPYDDSDVDPEIPLIGFINGAVSASISMPVHKFGRTTLLTQGYVDSISADINVFSNGSFITFENQIEIRSDEGRFSAPGDSGALILDSRNNNATGLLFAGSPNNRTFANPIDRVLSALKVELL